MMYDRDVNAYEYSEKTYKEGGGFFAVERVGKERVWRGSHQHQESSTGRPSRQDVWRGLSRPDLGSPHTRRTKVPVPMQAVEPQVRLLQPRWNAVRRA